MMSERPATTQEALHALGVMSGVLRYCPKHEVFYRGAMGPEAALPYYDKYLVEARQFFPTLITFYTALLYERARLGNTFCHQCARHLGYV